MTTSLRQKMIFLNKWSYCQHCTNKRKRVISKCPDCDDFLCISCKLDHSKNQRTKLHATYAVSEKDWREIEDLVTCEIHENDDLDMFCVTCEILVCPVCIENEHHSHKFTTIRQAARSKISKMYETYVPKIRSKFEYLQKEKRRYEKVSEMAIKAMDTRSRVMKAALSDIVDRMKNDQKTRDAQNINVYTRKIGTAYDEMIKKENILASCSGDSDWNNIVILKKGKKPVISDTSQITTSEKEDVPEVPEINEDEMDTILIKGLLSMFGKSKLGKDGATFDKEIDDDRKQLQLELTRLREENLYLKQELKRTSKDRD